MKKLTLLCVLGFMVLIVANAASVAAPSNEKGPRCSDGIDNDGDGLTDGDDPDCGGDGDGGSGGGVPAGNPSFVYSTRTSNSIMRVMDVDGSNDRVLSHTLSSGGGVFGPTPNWGPTGKEVAWADRKFKKPGGIVVVRLDGNTYPPNDPCEGETLCLLFENPSNFTAWNGGADITDWGVPMCIPGYSSDDRFIAFLGRGFIHVSDQDDVDVFLVSRENPATTVSELINVTNEPDENYEGLAWSVDSGRIAIYAFSDANPWGQSGKIAIIDLCDSYSRTDISLPGGHPVHRVISMDWGMQGVQDYVVVTSTEGVWIVEVVTDPNFPPVPIPVVSDTVLSQLNNPINAVWSPTGFEIAVSYFESDGSTAIAILDVTDVFNPSLVETISGTKPGRIDWRPEESP